MALVANSMYTVKLGVGSCRVIPLMQLGDADEDEIDTVFYSFFYCLLGPPWGGEQIRR